jgi:predicted kinase
VVNADQINEERGLPFGGEGLPESAWAGTLRIQLEHMAALAAAGRSVIVDDTLCYRWLRDRHREAARECGLNPVLLLFSAGREELLRRHARLSGAKQRPVLELERFQAHLDAFEWPAPDEHAVDVATSGRLDELVRSLRQSPHDAT